MHFCSEFLWNFSGNSLSVAVAIRATFNYTPRNEVVGRYTGFTISVRL